jgi:zinc transport system permease protein
MFDLFHYGFLIRGFEAGVIVALIAPLIGIFLVLRRYSLIADTLAHVSLAGVALGLLFGINPLLTAIISTVGSSVVIENLRLSKKIYGESALSIFLSGSLALAIVLIGLTHGFTVDIFNYLFGSLVTVRQSDVYVISLLGIIVLITITLLYKEFVYLSFDEESAKVSGLPTNMLNILLITLAALTVSVSIPIVGVLLISALIVIPVVTALQFKKSFLQTIFIAEIFSVSSVCIGIMSSFYLNISTGGTIVIVSIFFFLISLMVQ